MRIFLIQRYAKRLSPDLEVEHIRDMGLLQSHRVLITHFIKVVYLFRRCSYKCTWCSSSSEYGTSIYDRVLLWCSTSPECGSSDCNDIYLWYSIDSKYCSSVSADIWVWYSKIWISASFYVTSSDGFLAIQIFYVFHYCEYSYVF